MFDGGRLYVVNAKGEWVHKMINILIRGGFYFSFQKGGIFPVFCIGVHFWRFYISPLHIWQIPSSTKYFKLMRVSGIQFSSLSSHPHHYYCFIHSTQSLNFSQYPPCPRFQRLIISFLTDLLLIHLFILVLSSVFIFCTSRDCAKLSSVSFSSHWRKLNDLLPMSAVMLVLYQHPH